MCAIFACMTLASNLIVVSEDVPSYQQSPFEVKDVKIYHMTDTEMPAKILPQCHMGGNYTFYS